MLDNLTKLLATAIPGRWTAQTYSLSASEGPQTGIALHSGADAFADAETPIDAMGLWSKEEIEASLRFAAEAHEAMPLLLEAVKLLTMKCNPFTNNQDTHNKVLDLFERIDAFDARSALLAKPEQPARTRSPLGYLAQQAGYRLPLQVLQSGAGFYIGTADEEGPVSRESVEYWPLRQLAEDALSGKTPDAWTQRDHP